jgi:hypothetical protein
MTTAVVKADPYTGEVLPEARPVVSLAPIETPAHLVARATDVANHLAAVIENQKLYSTISGRKFVKCEGWVTLAAMMGVMPREIAMESQDGVYVATVALVRMADGAELTRASAECGAPDEVDRKGKPVWADRPRYARRSMAATRATSKACRLAFSWVMALAGFEVTPQEEMAGEEAKGSLDERPAASRDTEPPVITRDTPFPGTTDGKYQHVAPKDFNLGLLKWIAKTQPRLVEAHNEEWLEAFHEELKRRTAEAAPATGSPASR